MFAWYGKGWRPQHCRCPETRGGAYRMGVNGAHNTVGENVGAYNTAWVLSCQGGRRYCFYRCTDSLVFRF